MKELDFLPDWYKTSRRRRRGYRAQYIAIIGIFVAMMIWNFITTGTLSSAKAELNQLITAQAADEKTSSSFIEVKNELAQLEEHAGIIEQLGSKVDISNVLAEISFLVGDRIILNSLQFKAERCVCDSKNMTSAGNGAVVRVVRTDARSTAGLFEGNVRFTVVITGLAVDAADVAGLICRLEDSAYFCRIIPGFSKDKKVKDYHVTQFEISCYIANFIETQQELN